MAVIVNGDGILTGISSLTTALTDITSGRGTITGVTTVGTLQLGAGVSISSPRTQNAAIFTNNTEFLTVDDAGRVGVGTVTPNSDAHPENEKKINVGFITAKSIAGDIDARNVVVAGVSTFVGAINGTLTGTASGNAVLTGSTNNQLVTVTGANAITGESTLLFDGTDTLEMGTAAGGVGYDSNMKLRIGRGSDCQICVRNTGGDTNYGGLIFGDQSSSFGGGIQYHHNGDSLRFYTNGSNERLRITSGGKIGVNVTPSTGQFVVKNSDDANINVFEVYNDNGNMSGSFSQSSSGDGTVGVRKNDGTLNVFFRSNGVSYVKGGDFGVGTDSPDRKLDVSGTGNVYAKIQSTDATGAGIEVKDTSQRWLIQADGAGANESLAFYDLANTSYRVHMKDNGNLQIVNGDLKVADGHGIDFSADGNATNMTSELLDDYEEGTWNATSLNFQYDGNQAQRGSYVKIGRIVFAHFRVRFSTQTSTAHLRFSSLPFAVASGNPFDAGSGGFATGYSSKELNIEPSPGSAYAYWYTTTGSAYYNSTSNNGADIRGVIIYTASA